MSIDGVFINKLIEELQCIQNQKIQKIICLNNCDYVFNLQKKNKLYLSVDSNHPYISLNNNDYIPSSTNNSFFNSLRKCFEGNIILEISQYNNDRVIILTTIHFDDFGFSDKYFLIIELMGRNSNIIITNKDNIIIDSLKKNSIDNKGRIILNKIPYNYPTSDKINPYNNLSFPVSSINNYEGVSNLLFEEIKYHNSLSIIAKNSKPFIADLGQKKTFYCFDLDTISCPKVFYESISKMLDEFYFDKNLNDLKNNEQKNIDNYLKKETNKLKNKLQKLDEELNISTEHLKYEKIGNLLTANLYQFHRKDTSITLFDYETNINTQINLNPLLSPIENINYYFNEYKKSKRAISFIQEQKKIAQDNLDYLNCIKEQILYNKSADLQEIIDELKIDKMNSKNKKTNKKSKPNITIFHDIYDNTIFVGKNNLQNDYLTNKLALKTDYFFHVKSIGGSHVILRMQNDNENSKQLAADIAVYYSKFRNSKNENVDCTLVKNLKKVPGTKGSFVTYKTYNTFYGNPDINSINSRLKR